MDDRGRIEAAFPGLRLTMWTITSHNDPLYNCVAWAAGDTRHFWWPEGGFWPADVPRELTREAFRLCFEKQGFLECDNDALETNLDKVALFEKAGKPTHMARQLPNGHWTSKLGPSHDIAHRLNDIEGASYGTVAAVWFRPR